MKKTFMAALMAATALLSACNGKGSQPEANLKNDIDSLSYILGVANSPTDEEAKMYLMQAGSDSTYVEAFLKGLKDGINSSDDKKAIAYQMGMQAGMQMKTRMFTGIEQQVFAGDSTKHISTKQYLAGFFAAHSGNSGLYLDKEKQQPATRETVQPLLKEVMERMTAVANEKVFGEVKKQNEAFIAKMAKTPGVKPLDGGVYYKEIVAGSGAKPRNDQSVEVSYEGRLSNGTVFDSSQGQPVTFACNQVIPGFTTALTNMQVGSEWEVYIPWNQAYGAQQSGPIPPYSALVFKIKLVKIKD